MAERDDRTTLGDRAAASYVPMNPFGTRWTGTPQLGKIYDSSTGMWNYFYDLPMSMRPADDPTNSWVPYSAGSLEDIRSGWERTFPGVPFDPNSAVLGTGTNAQGNPTPGTFSGQEMIQAGNAGHGSWLDQQGSEIIGDALYAGAGFVGGPVATGILGLGADGSAESRREMQFSGLGALAGNLFGSPSTSGGNISDDGYSGSSGTGSLYGGTGSDTLAGGSTENYFGDYLTDPETGDVYSGGSSFDGSGVDQFGNPSGEFKDTGSLSSAGSGDFFNTSMASDPTYLDLAKKYGTNIAKFIMGKLGGGAGDGKQSLGRSILGQFGSDPLGSAFSAAPFLLALAEANRQGGDIDQTIGRLRELEGSVSGNASPYMNAVLNPYDKETVTGRAALLQDQGLRGVRGSSFGDQGLNSYDYTRGVGRGDIASKALLGSTALQGNLIGSELDAITKRNTNRNLLLGAGLSASGRLFQPEQDPFNLSTLLGLR